MTPNLKTKRTDSAQDRHDRAKKKPDRNRHVLGRFAILGAVTKWTSKRLSERQDGQ